MTTWTVLVWNMALGSRRNATKNWNRLSKLMEEHSVEVALLNEARVDHMMASNADAIREGRPEPFVFSEEGTKGRDFWTDENGIRKAKDRSDWSSAVMSPLGPSLLGEEDVRAMSASPTNPRRPDIPFTNSRAGSWIAATVPIGTEKVTCISLYGLIEELSDASMHRSLSEISPIFSDPAYKDLVLLGGDFNTTTAWPDHPRRVRDEGVLQRIKAYGLIDCLKQTRKPGRLENCTCVFGQDCQHTWTRLDPKQKGRKTPYQMDYLFASVALARRLTSCDALSPLEWQKFSDHSPIIAMFDERDGSG
jgi:endonuclease/exonuclease/phosphatase family metal-dependent hydrolase